MIGRHSMMPGIRINSLPPFRESQDVVEYEYEYDVRERVLGVEAT